METGCHSLHGLKHKAVIALTIVCSLLFYIICIHVHYYQQILETVGTLRNVDEKLQQEALHSLFTGSIEVEDGKYVLMKNGYQFSGQYYLFFDSFFITCSLCYLMFLLSILCIYKKYLVDSTSQVEKELDYLKTEIEHFLFGANVIRNNNYKECNYLLDRLEQKYYDMSQNNKNESYKMINFHQNIIHQINTPLNTIRILVEYLYNEGKIDKEYLDNMNYAIEKASDLAHIYLRTSKLDTGRVKYQFERIELFEMVEEVFFSLKIYAEYYHTILINKCDDGIIYADALWIMEALKNIIKNVIEYSGERKRIIVQSKTFKGSTIIYIDDNVNSSINIGNISFERFQSSQSGIGIGLNLCKQIVEAHLGQIKVEKSLLGGIRFIIILPKQPQKLKIKLEDEYENDCENERY